MDIVSSDKLLFSRLENEVKKRDSRVITIIQTFLLNVFFAEVSPEIICEENRWFSNIVFLLDVGHESMRTI